MATVAAINYAASFLRALNVGEFEGSDKPLQQNYSMILVSGRLLSCKKRNFILIPVLNENKEQRDLTSNSPSHLPR